MQNVTVQNEVDELNQLRQQLNTATTELEHFAYVASHDLKAPLRAVDNLASWIVEDIDDKDAVLEHCRLIQSRIKRAGTLLDDLLEYSRIGRVDNKIIEVEFAELVQDLFSQTKAANSFVLEIKAELASGRVPMPAFEQVLFKLIHNAVVHHGSDEGKVVVGVQQVANTVQVTVQDDGPGIEQRFHQKVFGLFEKMASKDEVEGSGMGLAIAKKIVEQYQGDIFLASQVGQGACFTLTWPMSSEHDDE